MAAFLNPWAHRSDLPQVEVHPLAGWVRNHKSACIPPPGASEEPGPDTIAAICEALLADRSLFMMETMTTFRNALFRTYGYGISPLTEVLTSFLEGRGAEIDLENGEIVVPGSYSWKWYLQFGDPDISGFTLHSSIRDGPRRMHILDTEEIPHFSMSPMECINGMMNQLGRAPRSLLDPNDHYNDLRNSHEFRVSVAHVWDPLRRRMEEQEAAEQAEQEAAEKEAALDSLAALSDEDEDSTLAGNNAVEQAVEFQRMLQFDAARVAANLRNLQEE